MCIYVGVRVYVYMVYFNMYYKLLYLFDILFISQKKTCHGSTVVGLTTKTSEDHAAPATLVEAANVSFCTAARVVSASHLEVSGAANVEYRVIIAAGTCIYI